MRNRRGSSASFIFSIVFIAVLTVVMTYFQRTQAPEKTFLQKFTVSASRSDITAEELTGESDSYSAYRITFAEDCSDSFAEWEELPLSGDGAEYLEKANLSTSVPGGVANGYWKMAWDNSSLCIYDSDEGVAYFVINY